MPKVSVVVPCYNVKAHINTCLDALLSQSMSDIEVICVDDSSTDGTLSILKEYAQNDSRIVVKALQQNSGVSVARNTGIQCATGEYIAFHDADDCVDNDFYEKLYKAAIKKNADIARGELRTVNIHGKTDEVLLNSRIKQNKYYFNLCFTTAIYRTAMVKKFKLGFPVGISMAEDRYFLISAVYHSNKIVTVDDTFYNYIRRENSLDSVVFLSEKIDSAILGSCKLLDWINLQHDLDSVSMDILVRCVADTVKYLLGKVTVQTDCVKVVELMSYIYENTSCKEALRKCWGAKICRCLKHKNLDKLVKIYMTKTKWGWLFGVFPLYKTTRLNQDFKFYFLGFLPIFKVRRTHKTEYFIFGLMVLKVK